MNTVPKQINRNLAIKLTGYLIRCRLSPYVQVMLVQGKCSKQVMHCSHPLVNINGGGIIALYVNQDQFENRSVRSTMVGPTGKEISDYRFAMQSFLAGYKAATME